jgi:predicted transcriptional regulator
LEDCNQAVLTALAEKPQTIAQLALRMSFTDRAMGHVVRALEDVGLVKRSGVLMTGKRGKKPYLFVLTQ